MMDEARVDKITCVVVSYAYPGGCIYLGATLHSDLPD